MFFLIVVFAVPYFFLSQISDGEKDVGGTDKDNRNTFTELINENMSTKQIPGILAHSTEFSTMRVRNEEEFNILKKIRSADIVKEAIPKVKAKKNEKEPEQ